MKIPSRTENRRFWTQRILENYNFIKNDLGIPIRMEYEKEKLHKKWFKGSYLIFIYDNRLVTSVVIQITDNLDYKKLADLSGHMETIKRTLLIVKEEDKKNKLLLVSSTSKRRNKKWTK